MHVLLIKNLDSNCGNFILLKFSGNKSLRLCDKINIYVYLTNKHIRLSCTTRFLSYIIRRTTPTCFSQLTEVSCWVSEVLPVMWHTYCCPASAPCLQDMPHALFLFMRVFFTACLWCLTTERCGNSWLSLKFLICVNAFVQHLCPGEVGDRKKRGC